MAWKRLTDRLAGDTAPEPSYAGGIPDHLDVLISDWLYAVLRDFDLAAPVAVRLRLPSTVLRNRDPNHLLSIMDNQKSPMLRVEIIDATLSCAAQIHQNVPWNRRGAFNSHVDTLEGILKEGNSAFTVSADGSGLELRINEALHSNFDKAVEAGRSIAEAAADHLREAFTSAYGIKPSPSAAYSHAIKAVEAVAIPLILPNDAEPTLGKVRARLADTRDKYEMVIADRSGSPAGIEAVIAMVSLLWFGQRDRHEGGPTSAPVTQEAAVAAIHTAAILVQWMSNGSIRKK